MCSDGHTLFDEDGTILNANKPICIGNHVWIGYAVTLLKGAVVPSGCQHIGVNYGKLTFE